MALEIILSADQKKKIKAGKQLTVRLNKSFAHLPSFTFKTEVNIRGVKTFIWVQAERTRRIGNGSAEFTLKRIQAMAA